MNRLMKAAWVSLLVACASLALKLVAWWVTGSVALYSDALETIINVVAACAALIALRISSKPADVGHPYGHQKAEYLSAVLEGMMVVGAAAAILHEVYNAWLHPIKVEDALIGSVINGLATLINAGWAYYLVRSGRAWKSPALIASGKHIFTDVWTSLGVLTGFALVPVTGWHWLDPALAALVAVNILWAGYGMVRESVDALMDCAVAPETLNKIRNAISTNADGAVEAHDVRTRASGHMTFIEFHLVVPTEMTVGDSHAICDRLEGALKDAVGEALITIHVEPITKAKHQGLVVLS